jgi:hypothetical protein
MFTTRPRHSADDDARAQQFNVTIDPATDEEVTGVCAVLKCRRRQLFREAMDALLGRRPPFTAAQHEALTTLLREWHELRQRPQEPEDD